jgi:hypothetical protein
MRFGPPRGSQGAQLSDRNGLIHRIAVYAIGVAIGLMLVGLLQRARMASHARQTAAMEAVDAAESGAATPADSMGADSMGAAQGAETFEGEQGFAGDASETAEPSNSP